ncbi:glycosyltransferase family 4 protein [Roseomonas sp. GCM10028921]
MRIEIVNERMLPRFGVDRLLVLLGQHLAARGHEVGFSSLRCDRRMLSDIGDAAVLDMPPGLDMASTEREVALRMRARLHQRRPDALVTGGWPFFRTAREAPESGAASVFIDAGAVAQDGLGEPGISVQRELRRIRQIELPGIDRIVPISRFIRDSQTIPDRSRTEGVRTVLLGGDHMHKTLFLAGQQDRAGAELLARLDTLRAANSPLLLLLGRFEKAGYKNSPAGWALLRRIRAAVPNARLLILDAGEDCEVPPDLVSAAIPLGQPDDATLNAAMRICAVGLSVSMWEGFNLPVVEMQRLNRPALAFNLGAHPEVIAHPWLLCDTLDEMADKTVRLLTGLAPPQVGAAVAASGERHLWENTLRAWEEEIISAAEARQHPPQRVPASTSRSWRTVLIDVTNAAVDPANSGVMRVTRTLCAHLQQQEHVRPAFARWDASHRTYRLLDGHQRQALANYGGPQDRLSLLAGPAVHSVDDLLGALETGSGPAALFLPEVVLDGGCQDRIAWARGRGMPTGAILYDLIPVDFQSYCDPHVVAAFPPYLKALLQVEQLWSISGYSMDRLAAYAAERGIALPQRSRVVWLPGQFGSHPRLSEPVSPPEDTSDLRIVCISTLEPRKNHASLLAGWQILRRRRPDLPVRLILIGNRYAGAPQVWEAVVQASAQDDRLNWRGVLNDAEMMAELDAAAFTVYPSLVEGFGLPILESLWLAKPCLVHDGGVMAELASPGGCYQVNMRDPAAIADALETLTTQPALRRRLVREASGRLIATWKDYAADLGADMAALSRGVSP